MQTKLRITLMIGEKAYFISALGDAKPPFVELVDYSVTDGRIEWEMKTSQDHRIVGRIRDKQWLPLYKDAWVTVSVPVTMHVRSKGLGVDFIFSVPSHVSIEKQSALTA